MDAPTIDGVARGSYRITLTLSVSVSGASARRRGNRVKRSVEKQRRTDPGSILHPSHPPGRWSQSARLVLRRNCGVRLKVLSRARQMTFSTQSQQADCKTTTSRAVELFGSAASGRYRTVTLWVTRPRTATLRYTSMRTECAQPHLLSLSPIGDNGGEGVKLLGGCCCALPICHCVGHCPRHVFLAG